MLKGCFQIQKRNKRKENKERSETESCFLMALPTYTFYFIMKIVSCTPPNWKREIVFRLSQQLRKKTCFSRMIANRRYFT